MTKRDQFALFASSGVWSGDERPSIPEDEKALTLGLTTYLFSIAVTNNRYNGEIQSFENWSRGALDIQCDPNEPNEVRTCLVNNNIGAKGAQIVLHYKDGEGAHPQQKATDLMGTMLDKGWSTIDTLFQGSFDCAKRGGFGQNLVAVNTDGTLDMTCMSQLDMCYSGFFLGASNPDLGPNYPCVVDKINGGCPIRNCEEGGD